MRTGAPWRDLPEGFGNWAAEPIWNFRSFLRCPRGDERDGAFGADVQFHRGARPCLGSGRKRGQHDQALGRSRGGFSTKIHLKTDFGGLPIAFHLTGGEASDSATLRRFSTSVLISIRAPHSVTKATNSESNRDAARQRGICPAIPYRSNTRDMPAFFPKAPYKARARIELAANTVPIIEVERTQRQCCIAALEVAGQLASPFGRPSNPRTSGRLKEAISRCWYAKPKPSLETKTMQLNSK